MSTSTTSASRRWAIRSAAEAPTFPAPMIETFFLITASFSVSGAGRHPLHDGVGELRAAEGPGALHLPGQVVRHMPARDGAPHALDDQVASLVPAQVLEQHAPRQDEGAGVHLVLSRMG